jgi:hypothetical protein
VSTPDEITSMIQDCIARESKLSDWEREFIQSIDEQLGRGRALTPKQDETLERIWTRVTE